MSLWQVPDAPTALLMQEFYRHWQPRTALWLNRMLPLLIGVLILLFLLRKRVSGWKLRKRTHFQWQQLPKRFLTAPRHFPQQAIGLYKNESKLVLSKLNLQNTVRALSSRQNWFQQIRYLRQHCKLVTIVVLSVAFLSFSLATQFGTQEAINKAQALRQAMLTTMKTNPEPAAWAAFTLMGEAR